MDGQYLRGFCAYRLDTNPNGFLQAVDWLHTLYMLLAVAILFVALLPTVRSVYKKSMSRFGRLS